MNDSILFMILLQVLLIGLNAIFACAEIAVISMNDNKLNKMASEGDKRASRLVKLTSQPARFLSTIQIAITLSGFLGSAFAAENFSGVIVSGLMKMGVPIPEATLNTIAVVFVTLVLSYFTLIFGELVPKQVAMRKAEPLALGLSALLSAIAAAFRPIVWFLTASTNFVLRLLGIDPNAVEDEVSEEEIRMMVDVGSEKGTIDNEEKEFIQNVFEFDDLSAGEIATHRTDIHFLYLEEPMEVWREEIHSSRYSLYPICSDSADHVVGILNTKDFFRLKDQSRESVMKNAVQAPYFVPESVKADILFRNMKKGHRNLAVVLDEYGGLSGIITLNDLVELLVGDLGDDEVEEEAPLILEQDGKWLIHGSASLEEVAESLKVSLPIDEYETFNGMVFNALGTIPQDGSNFEVETNGLHIKVTSVQQHQIERSVVTVLPKTEENKSE